MNTASPPTSPSDPRTLCAQGVEVWAPVPGTPYEASNLGRVRNPKTGRIVGTCRLKNGYFSLPGLLVQRAILAAFDGPQPPSIVARHGNDDRGDNRLTNLSWGTRAENAADTARAGRARTRTGDTVAPLDAERVEKVFARLLTGEITQQEAAGLLQRSSAWVSYQLRSRKVVRTVVRDTVDEEEARRLAEQGIEVWVRALGSHGLEVSNLGRVRNASTGKVYSLRPERRSGYIKVMDAGHLHRLVLTSFSAEPFPGAIVRHHPDPDRTNCALHNLCWGTYADNAHDTVSHGRSLRGEQHPRAVLTDAQVEEGLRLFVARGWTTEQLSDFLGGIGQGNASDIVTGASWAHVSRPDGLSSRRGRVGGTHHLSHLDDATVVAGLALAAQQGWGAVRLGRHLGVSTPTASQILTGKTWKHLPRPSRAPSLSSPDAGPLLSRLVARVEHLAQEAGEGRYRLPDDTYPVVTREELILATREAGREAVETSLLPAVFAFFRAHVAQHGWFYPTCPDTLGDTLAAVSRAGGASDTLSSKTHAGTGYLHGRFRSFWDVDAGPARAFAKDNLLRNVLRYRLGLNNSKDYTYTLSSGEVVSTRETFDINVKNVRRGFVVQRQTASFFKPSTACAIYRRWIVGTDAPTVWDASCGFGARLLGFAAAFPKGNYIGNEPASRTHEDVTSLAEDLVREEHLGAANIVRAGSEVVAAFAEKTLDLVFTSPPYFDLERYYDEPGQCWRDYPTLALWRENYLLPTLSAAHAGLKDDALLVLNVDEARRAVVVEAAQETGFWIVTEQTLLLGSDHFARKRDVPKDARGEPVLVFAKV